MDKYAVIGNPIKHSQSPQIHSAFAAQEGIQIEYRRILADQHNFVQTVNHFFAEGGKGINVTVPFKLLAYQHCIELDEFARAAQAVNTLCPRSEMQWAGSNTDGIGLITDLTKNLKIELANKNILILGAGGATRGILLPLLQQHPAFLTIANRNVDKAHQLENAFQHAGNIRASSYSEIGCLVYDIVINATSASLTNTVPPIPPNCVSAQSICYDLAYGNEPTVFMNWAKTQGIKQIYDGYGMLVEQAAESYYQWRDYRPDTGKVFQRLRANG